MLRKSSALSILTALPVSLLAACGGGDTSGTGVSSSALSELASEVPIAGQFLADCTEDGLAVIQDFVGALPAPDVPVAGVPSIGDVLVLGDPDAIPVIGGLEAPALPGGDLVPTDLDSALSMIPLPGLPADLPVAGLVPVTCDDLPLPTGDLPDPTDAVGLIPVFDGNGDPVAVVLAVVGQASGDAPSVTDVTLPGETALLPEPLGSAIGTLTALLNLLPL